MAKIYAGWPYNLCQMGREAAAGTAVAATIVWRGPFGSPEDDRNRNIAEESIGLIAPTTRTYDTWLGAKLAMPETELTTQQVAHILEAGMMNATPGAGPAYLRTYLYSLTATPNPIKTYTLELGNQISTADLKKLVYAYVEEFTLSGKNEEAWKMSASWRGQQMATLANFTAALSAPAVNEVMFANTLLYIDEPGGTIGTTQKLGVLMGASIKVKTGIAYVPVGDGGLFYTAVKYTRPEVTYTLTLELEQDTGVSTVAAERAKFEAGTGRLIRLKNTDAATRILQIDLSGKYTKIGGYDKQGDGNTTVTFEGRCDYSATDALFFTIALTNKLATL